MTSIVLFSLLAAAPQDAPAAPGFKLEAVLAEAPGPRLVCEGSAEVPDGIVLNVEIFIEGRSEPLGRHPVRVKEGRFVAPFDLFKGCERNLPGSYRARVSYHPGFQPKPIEDVAPFQRYFPLKLGTADEVIAAQRAVRERLMKDLKEFGGIGDDIRSAFEAAKGKIVPAEWQKLTEGWKARCLAIEKRAAKDPEYAAMGYGNITMTGTEHLRNQVRLLVEAGGGGREADLQLGREQLDSMIRTMILETAPAGSTSAERQTLVRQARTALQSSLDAEGPAFAGCKKGFTEAVMKLGQKAPPEVRDDILLIAAQGRAFFDEADASRERGRQLLPDLDQKLAALLKALLKTE